MSATCRVALVNTVALSWVGEFDVGSRNWRVGRGSKRVKNRRARAVDVGECRFAGDVLGYASVVRKRRKQEQRKIRVRLERSHLAFMIASLRCCWSTKHSLGRGSDRSQESPAMIEPVDQLTFDIAVGTKR